MSRPKRPGGRQAPGGRQSMKLANKSPQKIAPRLKEMLRVDHAGEFAAVAIYDAQSKVFGRSRNTAGLAKKLAHMRDEEQEHLDAFNDLLLKHQARPTALIGLWEIASTGLGIGTALMGEKAAHACTEAVESVIEQHYAEQIEETKDVAPELSARFTQFREDELRHRDDAIELGAKDALGYPLLSTVIKAGCRTAIKLSEKI